MCVCVCVCVCVCAGLLYNLGKYRYQVWVWHPVDYGCLVFHYLKIYILGVASLLQGCFSCSVFSKLCEEFGACPEDYRPRLTDPFIGSINSD